MKAFLWKIHSKLLRPADYLPNILTFDKPHRNTPYAPAMARLLSKIFYLPEISRSPS